MTDKNHLAPILMAEDDKDDQLITQKALEENRVANPLVVVEDGEQLMDYLNRKGSFAGYPSVPQPCFILLDLNMPKMDGREALKAIKSDEKLKRIPVVILTTSKAEEDILKSYHTGANSYITKPVTFQGLVTVIRSLKTYWLEIVDLPARDIK
jgi:two-component system, response regulator